MRKSSLKHECPLAAHRRGATCVLGAIVLVFMMAIVAFVVDVGYLLVAKADLQRSADAAAHAAVQELRRDAAPSALMMSTRATAVSYAESNAVMNSVATVDPNHFNQDRDGDVLVGTLNMNDPSSDMIFGPADEANAVRVTVRRSAKRNGELPLFFARVLGHNSMSVEASATAAIIKNVGGFRVPRSGENVPMLPVTVSEDYWEEALEDFDDDWGYDRSGGVDTSSDGIPEVVLFPRRTGGSGNLGTLRIGTETNGTPHLGRQIRQGLSKADLDHHGGKLALNSNGQLKLNGNPGLSASLSEAFASRIGEPLVIPLYREVEGSGANAEFTIVKFVGVRVMAVKLNGGEKYLSVQPANVVFGGTIQGDRPGASQGVYSPPVLVK